MAVLKRRTSITYRALHTRSKELAFFLLILNFLTVLSSCNFETHDLLLAQNVIDVSDFLCAAYPSHTLPSLALQISLDARFTLKS